MAADAEQIRKVLDEIEVPNGGTLMSRDLVRALTVDGGTVRFVCATFALFALDLEELVRIGEMLAQSG